MQNFPNPFNPSTTIRFTLAERSYVKVSILDMLGRQVATVVSQELPEGTFNTTWDASEFPSGIYLVRLQAGAFETARRISLVR
jgi:fibronectin type 3 domain-containing protein